MKQQEEIDNQKKEIDNLKKYIMVLEEDNQQNKDNRKAYEHNLKRKVYLHLNEEKQVLKRKLESDLREAKRKYIKVIYIISIYSVLITILFILKLVIKI